MNSRERLTRCYFNKELDRPAVYIRTAYPKGDPSYDELKKYFDTHTELKLDWNATSLAERYPVEKYTEPVSELFDRSVNILHTPAGDLKSSVFHGLKGNPGLNETYYINSREDAEKYLSLPLPEIRGDVSSFFDAVRNIGDKGIVHVNLGANPGGSTVKLFGPENFALMSITDRDIIEAICERNAIILTSIVKYLIERNAGPFFTINGQEEIVPPLHGPKDFYDFNVKYDKPLADLIHNAGGRIHVHCHGSIKKVLPGFLEEGIDVLHPFEAPPMGDITASEAKAMIRGRMCMEGNIQIAHMYEHTPEQMWAETEALMRDAFDDHKGLIVCPTASPYIFGKGTECFEVFKAMVDTVLQWKG